MRKSGTETFGVSLQTFWGLVIPKQYYQVVMNPSMGGFGRYYIYIEVPKSHDL